MTNQTNNILIVGAGSAGTALIKLLKDKESTRILAVADRDENAPGLQLAKDLNIPTGQDWAQWINDESLNEVINMTGSDDVQAALADAKPGHVTVMSGYAASVLCFLAKEYAGVEEKIRQAKEDVEAHEWGVQKTNEAIKTLYKELEEKNKELQELDSLKSDFISTVSHELRTPLAITKEGISLIQDGVLGPVSEQQAKVLQTSRDSIDRLSRLIASLLDISKIEAGGKEVEKGLISLTHVAEQMVALFESKASDKGLQVRAKVPDHDVDVYADGDKIIQVFTNLINNAIKFTEKGSIVIGVTEADDEVECFVEDTGRGVPQKDLQKMFNKFQQINREHGDGEQGTGLGLSIAKSIVEMHDGRIWAESDEGKGCRITFTIPKCDEKSFFLELVGRTLKEAKSGQKKLSLMVVGVDQAQEANGSSQEEARRVLKDIEGILKDNMDNAQCVALMEAGECALLIADGNKQNVLSTEGRLKQAIDDYLMHEKLSDKVTLRFGCAIYPDEAQTAEELIEQALKG